MFAIQDCKATITAQIETIHTDFSLLEQDVQNLWDRTVDTEVRISTVKDTLAPLTTTVCEKLPVKWMTLKTDPAATICVLWDSQTNQRGLTEQFLLAWLRGTLGQDVIPTSFAIEWAHCTPLPNPAYATRHPSLLAYYIFKIKWLYMSCEIVG